MIHGLVAINPGIKVIAASGLDIHDHMTKLAGIDVKHFLSKPYTSNTLLKILRSVLDEK